MIPILKFAVTVGVGTLITASGIVGIALPSPAVCREGVIEIDDPDHALHISMGPLTIIYMFTRERAVKPYVKELLRKDLPLEARLRSLSTMRRYVRCVSAQRSRGGL